MPFVRIGRGETLCSIRLDLEDAFVRNGRGETLCSIRLDLLDALTSELEKERPSAPLD
jgi:hypothetical protein